MKMDKAFVVGLGISVISLFLPMAVKQVPPQVAWAGLVVGIAIAIWAVVPEPVRPNTGQFSLYVVGALIIAGAAWWQLADRKKPIMKDNPGPAQVAHAADHVVPPPPAGSTPSALAPVKAVASAAPAPSPSIERQAREAPMRVDTPDDKRGERAQMLTRLTQLYINSHDGITSEMMSGLELPPAEWLNAQLERYGADWRVRSTRGPNADIYGVPASGTP